MFSASQFLFMWVWKCVAHWYPTLFLFSPILYVPCWLMFAFSLHSFFLSGYYNVFNTGCLKQWAPTRRRNLLWMGEEPSHQTTPMVKKMRSLRWRLLDWYLEDLIHKVQFTVKPWVYFYIFHTHLCPGLWIKTKSLFSLHVLISDSVYCCSWKNLLKTPLCMEMLLQVTRREIEEWRSWVTSFRLELWEWLKKGKNGFSQFDHHHRVTLGPDGFRQGCSSTGVKGAQGTLPS